jgi:hypothetical protein
MSELKLEVTAKAVGETLLRFWDSDSVYALAKSIFEKNAAKMALSPNQRRVVNEVVENIVYVIGRSNERRVIMKFEDSNRLKHRSGKVGIYTQSVGVAPYGNDPIYDELLHITVDGKTYLVSITGLVEAIIRGNNE